MIKYVIITILLVLCLFPILSAQGLSQDVVYLKNGSIIKGQIIEQIPNVTIKIQTRDGSVFVYKIDEIEKITKEFIEKKEIQELKSPGIAFVLSFLVPGLGQIYNEEYKKGAVQFLAVVTGGVLIVTGIEHPVYSGVRRNKLTPNFYAGCVLYSIAWLWSWVDAPTSATRINMAQQQNQGYLFEYNKDKYRLGFDIGPKNRGIEAKLKYHF